MATECLAFRPTGQAPQKRLQGTATKIHHGPTGKYHPTSVHREDDNKGERQGFDDRVVHRELELVIRARNKTTHWRDLDNENVDDADNEDSGDDDCDYGAKILDDAESEQVEDGGEKNSNEIEAVVLASSGADGEARPTEEEKQRLHTVSSGESDTSDADDTDGEFALDLASTSGYSLSTFSSVSDQSMNLHLRREADEIILFYWGDPADQVLWQVLLPRRRNLLTSLWEPVDYEFWNGLMIMELCKAARMVYPDVANPALEAKVNARVEAEKVAKMGKRGRKGELREVEWLTKADVIAVNKELVDLGYRLKPVQI